MKFKNEFKVGLFIVITSFLIVFSSIYILYKKGFFEKEYAFTLSSKTGDELTVGMPVVFSGFKIGKVIDLQLNQNGMVMIKISVPSQHIKWIRSDSVFSLYKPLIGVSKITISTDNLNASFPTTGKVFKITTIDDINNAIKQIQPIINKITKVISNIETITGNIADPKGDVNKILRNANNITIKVDSILADFENIMEYKVDAIISKIDAIALKIEGIISKVDVMASKTGDEIYGKDGILPNVRNILKEVILKLQKFNTTIDNIEKISSEAVNSTKDLKSLRREIDAAVFSINKIVNEIDKKIPFKTKKEIKLP